MNNHQKYRNMIDTLEEEMKALATEVEERVRIKANTGPCDTQYILRERARNALLDLFAKNNVIGMDNLMKETS
jgi:hypothetical protein